MAQSRQRKAANISRQQDLVEKRQAALGDPVKSQPTPFIQQLGGVHTDKRFESDATKPSTPALNYFVKATELDNAFAYSSHITEPLPVENADLVDPLKLEKELKAHAEYNHNAQEAIRRIVSLGNGNTKDRTRVNIQNCIETFGRHNTDEVLPPKPAPGIKIDHPEKTPRAGPDTGSAEVQVAILTTKILNLSRHLESTTKDRHNKRNLRILVHKRQKLLRYLREKERGGPRWQNLMESLGLSDAAWKGEISM
jgi:ribosomal protein S15